MRFEAMSLNAPNGQMGNPTGLGDFNNDGLGDFAVSAPQWSAGGLKPDAGAAYLIFGRAPMGSHDVADIKNPVAAQALPGIAIEGTVAGDEFGKQMTGLGRRNWAMPNALKLLDFNADGLPDWVISAPGRSVNGKAQAGAIAIIWGNSRLDGRFTWDQITTNDLPGIIITGANQGDRFGEYMVEGGDINGDGSDDLIVVAPGAENPVTGAGRRGDLHHLRAADQRSIAEQLPEPVGHVQHQRPDGQRADQGAGVLRLDAGAPHRAGGGRRRHRQRRVRGHSGRRSDSGPAGPDGCGAGLPDFRKPVLDCNRERPAWWPLAWRWIHMRKVFADNKILGLMTAVCVTGLLLGAGCPASDVLSQNGGQAANKTTGPTFDFTAPTARPNVAIGTPIGLAWTDSHPAGAAIVRLFYDIDGSAATGDETTITFVNEPAGTTGGGYTWNTTTVVAGVYRVGAIVDDHVNPPVASYLAYEVVIGAQTSTPGGSQGAPTLALVQPATDQFLLAGQSVMIHWSVTNVSAGSTLSLYYDTDLTADNGNEVFIGTVGVGTGQNGSSDTELDAPARPAK